MPPRKKAGYDCVYREELDPFAFSEEVVRALTKKGFCTIFDDACRQRVPEIITEASAFDSQWISTPVELSDGLLGPEGSSRHAIVEPEDSALGAVDAMMSTLSGLLNPWAEYLLDCCMSSRTDTFLLEPGKPTSTFPTPKEAMVWLEIFSWQKILVLFFTGSGVLELTPLDAEAEGISVTTEQGLWIVLRADALHHVFQPSSSGSYVLMSFFLQDLYQRSTRSDVPAFKVPSAQKLEERILESVRHAKENASSEQEFQDAVTRSLQFQANRMFHKGVQVAIRGQAVRAAGDCLDYEQFYSIVYSGLDAATDVNDVRWDHRSWFHPDPDNCMELEKTYSKHSCFYEGTDLFDNKHFGISQAETASMDPSQRQILEVSYTAMHAAGWRRKSLMKSWTGVAIGASQGEFGFAPKCPGMDGNSTSSALAIVANRISYLLGLQGPSYGVDMEGAAGMVAVNQCADMVQHGKLQADQALAGGVEIITAVNPSLYMSWAGMLSRSGRCCSFDESADGFIRGEVTGTVFMNSLMREIDGHMVIDENPQIEGIISSAMSGHNGKTSSMTAPSGSADIELLSASLRRACLDPLDVDVIECHGLGQIFQDAVEEAAIARVYRSSHSEEMLACTANKTTFGNAGRGAGMVTVLKMLGIAQWGAVSPIVHLSVHNPHVEISEDAPIFFATESLQNRLFSTFSAGTAKSWSGCSAHSIFYGVVDSEKFKRREKVKEAAKQIVFWPGGGGFLERSLKPLREYTIVGTWSSWEPEGMKSEGKGVYSHTVTLGESGYERFQIFLDGDPDRVLHPNCVEGAKDMQVHGPASSSESFGNCWQIDGRSKLRWRDTAGDALEDKVKDATRTLVKVDGPDVGEPGDQYTIRIETLGKYRLVTWEKIVEQSDEVEVPVKGLVPKLDYSVIGSFTGWQPHTMTRGVCENGTTFTYEVQDTREHVNHEFQIIVNDDMCRVVYPQTRFATGGPAMGPDELGRGCTWQLKTLPEESYKIVMERTMRSGVMVSKVYTEPIATSKEPQQKIDRYYVIGSWDGWRKPIAMLPASDGCHVVTRHLPAEGSESFQVLLEGHAGLIGPSVDNANPYSYHAIWGPSPSGSHLSWTVGDHEADRRLKGCQYRIILKLTDRGRPNSVTWEKLVSVDA